MIKQLLVLSAASVLIGGGVFITTLLWFTLFDTNPPGENQQGHPGNKLTIICRNLHGIAVLSQGGKGGIGSQGPEGKDGSRD